MTSKHILKMLNNFNLETLAPYEREHYKKNREKWTKQFSLLEIIRSNRYSSEELTVLAEFINEYEITIK